MSDTEEQDSEVAAVNPDDSTSEDEPDERDEQAQNDHPWPYLKEMFTFVGSKKDSWRMNCVLCRPKVRELLAYKNSPSNLKKHIERKHNNHMDKYLKLTSIKRKSSEPEEGKGPPAKQAKLEQLHISSKYCSPLVDALQAGLEKRFGQMLGDPELIAAAILVPKFRTTWTCNEEILKSGLDYIKSHLKDQPTVHSGNTPQSSDEEDFFSTIKKGKAHENTKQLESYLANPDDDMDVLKSYPAVCHLSLMLNTPLPASAACERLFSTAGLILRPKRARIGSKNFENQLLLKLNKPFW